MTAAKPSFRRGFVIAGVAAVFMATIGALGTDAVSLPVRLGYWLTVMVAGSALGTGVAFGVHSWGRLRHRRLVEGGLVTLLIAVPLTLLVIGANLLTFGTAPSGFESLATMFGIVLMVSAMMTALAYATGDRAGPEPGLAEPAIAPAAVSEIPQPRILARLPLRLRHAQLQALEAEDHYLRVHTDAGSDLILMRLADAIAETDGLAGARCHRSWWVAREAVTGTVRQGGRIMLEVAALRVPVSRSYTADLRAGGWLE